MKKIVVAAALLAFVFVGAKAGAQQEEKNNIEAKNVKLHKKQILSDEERSTMDKIKGTPAGLEEKAVFALPATGILGAPIPTDGERYAIVIGLANYTGTANDLCVLKAKTRDQFPEDNGDLTQYCQDYDSVHMREALVNEYGYASGNISFLHDGYATRAEILAAMEDLRNNINLDDKDEVVFFFSGHGTTGNYTLPGVADVDADNVDEGIFVYDGKVIWDDDLKAWADSLNIYRTVFAFDICMAGGMNDLAGANRIVAMSSGEIQNSWTYYLGGYNTGTRKNTAYQYSEGLFSRNFVLDGMTKGLADGISLSLFKDGKVAIEEAFGYTYPIIQLKQQPVLKDDFLNDLVLGSSI